MDHPCRRPLARPPVDPPARPRSLSIARGPDSLFMRLKGLIPGVPSFLEAENVYVSSTGVSFYEQCFPPASIRLGFSFTAMHWLTRSPGGIAYASFDRYFGDHFTRVSQPCTTPPRAVRRAHLCSLDADWCLQF